MPRRTMRRSLVCSRLFVKMATQYLSARRPALSKSSRTSQASANAFTRTAESTTLLSTASPGSSPPLADSTRSNSAARACCWSCSKARKSISTEDGRRPGFALTAALAGVEGRPASEDPAPAKGVPGVASDGEASIEAPGLSASSSSPIATEKARKGRSASSATSHAALSASWPTRASSTRCRAGSSSVCASRRRR